MAKLHLRATITAAPDNHQAVFRPIPKDWRINYSDEFLGLAQDLLAQNMGYGLVLWKVEHEHPTIWADRGRKVAPEEHPPVKPSLDVPKPKLMQPTQPSLGLDEPDDPIRPDVPKPTRVRPHRKL